MVNLAEFHCICSWDLYHFRELRSSVVKKLNRLVAQGAITDGKGLSWI